MKRNLQVFYAFFSGIILALAIQNELMPFGNPFLGLLALIPLYIALSSVKTPRMAGILFSIQITVTHLLSSFWLGFFKEFAIFTIGGTALWYCISGYFIGQLFYAVFFIPKHKILYISSGKDSWFIPRRVMLFTSLMLMYEWNKSTGFLAYPWGTVYMSSYSWKTITQIASITGTAGISALFILFSSVIAEGYILLDSARIRSSNNTNRSYAMTAAFCISMFALSTIYGVYEYTKNREPVKYMETVIVQQNTDDWIDGSDENGILISQELTSKAISDKGNKPDIVLWSELVLTYVYFPNYYEEFFEYPEEKPLLPFIQKTGVPFIIGGYVRFPTKAGEQREYGNSALYFDKDATYKGFSAKTRLVPFAELIPYSDKAWMRKFMQKIVGFSSGWTPGKELTLFSVPLKSGENVKIANLVCFEDAFSDLCRDYFHLGSEVFINITNDSWSKTKSAEFQHFVVASFRAIEMRTTLVRSTNSGYSAVVNPAGTVLFDMPLFTADSLCATVPVYKKEMTPYALLGNWLPLLCGVFLLTSFILAVFFRFKEDHE